MKFTIVTISFNQRPYLQQAIESVINQDYPDLEYIVVDPGSTDGSRELIESYGSRITHRLFEPDGGAADGLNKGFRQATGDIFGFLNSDDVLRPQTLRKVADFMARNPQYDLVMGDGHIVDANNLPLRHIRATSFTPMRYLYGGTNWLQQSTFFKREAFERVGGFNPINRSSWDGELFLQMIRTGSRVAYLREDLSYFRIHGESISGARGGQESHPAYQKDKHRIFEAVRGRKWRSTDHLIAAWLRFERFVRRPGDLKEALRARLPGRLR